MKEEGFLPGSDDILRFPSDKESVTYKRLATGDEVLDFIIVVITRNTSHPRDTVESWFSKGIPCELLQPGANWSKGRIVLELKYIPDKLEAEEVIEVNQSSLSEPSPLDDLRVKLNLDNE